MGNKRDWQHTRSTHADVLESLERVIRAHPSGSANRSAVTAADTTATVVDLRPRLAVLHGGGAGPAGGHPDGNDAA